MMTILPQRDSIISPQPMEQEDLVKRIANQDYNDPSLPDESSGKDFYLKYEPKELLGKGGSSFVRRCIEKKTGKDYAVKIVDISGSYTSQEERDLLYSSTIQEINIIKRVSPHPNIIEIHDSFITSSFIFLVLEMCKDELYDYLAQEVTLSEKKTKKVMYQLLNALAYMHNLNVVHRDVKAENILVADNNLTIKVTDLGFAVYIDNDYSLHDLCGTPGYLAPEILQCRMFANSIGYGRPVDIWASGVLMYSLMVGTSPFWHKKQLVMFRRIMECDYNLERSECADISDIAKDLIRNMIKKDPDKRFTAKEALKHPFFYLHVTEEITMKFEPKKKFRKVIIIVMAVVHLRRSLAKLEFVTDVMVQTNPYKPKIVHKYIDSLAFRVYGHWVKKGTLQNRALLFENRPKKDLKQMALRGVNISDLFPKY